MSVYNLKLDSLVSNNFVFSVCQKNFEPPNNNSIWFVLCERWFYFDCCWISKHELFFYIIMKIYFYCTDCVNDLGLINVGSDDYCKSCSEKISNPDDCLFCEGCYK